MIFINDSEIAYPGGNYWKGGGQSYISTVSMIRYRLCSIKQSYGIKNLLANEIIGFLFD